MSRDVYLSAEVCRVLDCRIHHLSYIEEHLPLISTRFDEQSRRIYNLRDVFLFSRILHLTRSRGLSLNRAIIRISDNLEGSFLDSTARFFQIRHELLKSRLRSIQAGNRLALKFPMDRFISGPGNFTVSSAQPSAHAAKHPLSLFSSDGFLPGDSFERLELQLRRQLQAVRDRNNSSLLPEPDDAVWSDSESEPINTLHLLEQGQYVVLTPDPGKPSKTGSYAGAMTFSPIRRLTLLEYMAEHIRAAANMYGAYPLWVIGVRKKNFHHLLGLLHSRSFFSIPMQSILILPQPDYLGQGTSEAGALFALSQVYKQGHIDFSRKFGIIYSLEHPMTALPDEQLVESLFAGGDTILNASIRSDIQGELYFRMSRLSGQMFDHDNPGISRASVIYNRDFHADTSVETSFRLPSTLWRASSAVRPYRWEFFPPFYGLDSIDSRVLEQHMLKVHRSWLGVSGGLHEISPLYARSREEMQRRFDIRTGPAALYE